MPGKAIVRRKELICGLTRNAPACVGVERIFGTARQTLARWLRDKAERLPALEATLLAAAPDHVLAG